MVLLLLLEAEMEEEEEEEEAVEVRGRGERANLDPQPLELEHVTADERCHPLVHLVPHLLHLRRGGRPGVAAEGAGWGGGRRAHFLLDLSPLLR